ncbi:MAG TPA: hypothetical protein VEN79_15900 [Terriglobia bacterium]|nr:hypothetical protein [Terriglobia bacterium]
MPSTQQIWPDGQHVPAQQLAPDGQQMGALGLSMGTQVVRPAAQVPHRWVLGS